MKSNFIKNRAIILTAKLLVIGLGFLILGIQGIFLGVAVALIWSMLEDS